MEQADSPVFDEETIDIAQNTDEPLFFILFDKDSLLGLPRRLAIYQIGSPTAAGPYYKVPIAVMREVNLQVLGSSGGPETITPRDARALAIRYFIRMAENLSLEVRFKPVKPQ